MTRVTIAVARAQGQIDSATPAAVHSAAAELAVGPEPIKAAGLAQLAVMRGQINAQEGGQLSKFASKYGEASLAERIALSDSLAEFMGVGLRARGPLIREG